MENNMLSMQETDEISQWIDLPEEPYKLIDLAENAYFNAEREMWKVCYVASLIVGKFTEKTAEMAGRLGVTSDTIQFYAKAWRVADYVKNESVPCTLHITGIAPAELIRLNLSMTHYGLIHSKIFVSERTDQGMKYIPIMSAHDALTWLAECVEPIMSEGKRLSPQALLAMMKNSPTTTQWWQGWGSIRNKILDFLVEYGEKMPRDLRTRLNEILSVKWDSNG